jgi:hypothetical protein
MARTVASIFMFMILTLSATGQVLAQEGEGRIATGGLNEFDLARSCGQEYRPGVPLANRRFGFASLSTGQAPQFVYITSRYYVELGPHGDPGDCKFMRYLYRLDKGGSFKREEIGAKRFAQIYSDLQTNTRIFEQSNPGQYLDPTLRESGDRDSEGGCLLPIYWQKIRSQTYALFSIAAGVGVISSVVPHYANRDSDCNAWGERRLDNASVYSDGVHFLSVNVAPDLIFVESNRFQMGFLFKPDVDFQCLKGDDAFSEHILISRKTFDLEVRPHLDALIKKRAAKWQLSLSSNEPEVLSFADSVFLSHEFSTFLEGLATKKGCK